MGEQQQQQTPPPRQRSLAAFTIASPRLQHKHKQNAIQQICWREMSDDGNTAPAHTHAHEPSQDIYACVMRVCVCASLSVRVILVCGVTFSFAPFREITDTDGNHGARGGAGYRQRDSLMLPLCACSRQTLKYLVPPSGRGNRDGTKVPSNVTVWLGAKAPITMMIMTNG
jgi:hypothetical protein